MKDQLLHSIVEKIVSGKKDWTSEELQYQRNFPNVVEKALHEYRQKAETLDKVSVIHYDCTLIQISKIAEQFGMWPRTLSFPEAVALSIIKPTHDGEETTMLILTVVGEVLDVALITIENGVYEVSYANCISQVSADSIYRIWLEIRLDNPTIDRLLIVTTEAESFRYKTLVERLFGLEAECMDNLHQLVQRGREMQAGILTGEVKGVLLLSVMPLAIGIEVEEGLMQPIIGANTTIPTRKSETISLDANVSEFSVAIWQGNECYARENTLVGVLSMKNQMLQLGKKRELEIVVEIDSNMRCVCRLTDNNCNVTTKMELPYYMTGITNVSNNMITRVITIGSDAKCDFVINRATWPSLREDIIERIKPIHAKIIQDDGCYYLIPYDDYIYINDVGIGSPQFHYLKDDGLVRMRNDAIQLDFDNRVSFGIDIFWQQWMAGLGLNCNQCAYRKHRLPEDGWCRCCEEQHYNPAPYIYGFSSKFEYEKRYTSGYYNYTDCELCNCKPDWCVECNFFLEKEPKNRSYKEHVEMYIQRLEL